ncbi:site-specific integrase [Mesorhizobium sp. 10J20-29]
MATIRKRGTNWQVQIRRQNMPPVTRTFLKKSDATEWARFWETKADRNELPENTRNLNHISLGELVQRYLEEIVPTKKGAVNETIVLNAFMRDPICQKKLSVLATSDFAAYRDGRLETVAAKSVARWLSPLSNMFRIARVEWGLPLSNPLADLRLITTDRKRHRRLRTGELDRLLFAIKKSRNRYVKPIILFAIETAMRRGEILAMQWSQVDFERRSVAIPEAKNGHSRAIPLTLTARDMLLELDRSHLKVFPLTPVALRLAWDRLTTRAGLVDLHFHDLRHEAISRFFEMGLTVPEVASISGHRDIRMLLRYAHADTSRLTAKLDNQQ